MATNYSSDSSMDAVTDAENTSHDMLSTLLRLTSLKPSSESDTGLPTSTQHVYFVRNDEISLPEPEISTDRPTSTVASIIARTFGHVQNSTVTDQAATSSSSHGDVYTSQSTFGSFPGQELDLSHIYQVRYALGAMTCVVCFALILVFVLRKWRPSHSQYLPVPGNNSQLSKPKKTDFKYVYKPLKEQKSEEDFDNTFVGISVPLLQEVTPL